MKQSIWPTSLLVKPLRVLGILALAAAFLIGVASNSAAAPPHAAAVFTRAAPVVDGKVESGEWSRAKPIFFPGAKFSHAGENEVRFLWTLQGVYLAFETMERTPIYGYFKPGLPIYQEDAFEIFIDQKGDHRQWYELQVNPAGQMFLKNYVFTAPPRVTKEGRLAQEYCDSEMWRYDMPVPAGVKVVSKFNRRTHRWIVEAFLPADMVNRRRGGAPMAPCTWRLNLARYDWTQPPDVTTRQSSFQYWAPVKPGHPHISPTLMGYLELKKP